MFFYFPSKTDVHVYYVYIYRFYSIHIVISNRLFTESHSIVYKVSQFLQQRINSSCMF